MKRLLVIVSVLVLASSASAQTGVSSDRVSLPDGPGSLEGVGGNVGVNANMGQMSYQVAIATPEGFPGLTPALGLSYSSGGGNSVAGMGWSLETPTVERMTSRGVPKYALTDRFAADGSTELVQVATTPPTYRAKCEGGFVRYSWLDAGTAGAEGYWKAEYPDGRVGYFGADSKGKLVATARVAGAKGTFRYLLVETVDVYGRALRYAYAAAGNVSVLQSIGYVHDAAGTARFRVTFDYEKREDAISDAKPGVELRLEQRLSAVNVYSGTQRLRSYRLTYEGYATSGGLSRLVKVDQLGLQDGVNPTVFTFQYSQALGATCSGPECGEPTLTEMGSLGVNLASRKATLLDLNGDSLPDVVDSSQPKHRIFLSQLSADGTHKFAAPVDSKVGTSGGHALDAPAVQPLDVDGDGFTDLVNTKTSQVLRNKGKGDWTEAYTIAVAAAVGNAVDLGFDDEDATPGNVRFLDYDNDRKIDILQAGQAATQLYGNAGGLGFTAVTTEKLEWAFDKDQLDLADMNGDGLMDPVNVTQSTVSYRLNLGDGRWGPVVNVPFTSADPAQVQLEDINGDSLADIVVVVANTVKYALNRNGSAFQAVKTISSAKGVLLPDRSADPSMTVLFADMNGNGSDDVVWIDGSGKVTYLELFPVRPHLLTRIENGLGAVTTVTYSTSVLEAARDAAAGKAWANKLPHSMVVVSKTDAWDELTKVHETTNYVFHDAYYDGVEKAFRGFGRVEQVQEGDATQEASRVVEVYDLGTAHSCRHGLLLSQEAFSEERPLSLSETTYGSCALEGVVPEVAFICKQSEQATIKEGLPEDSWVVTRTEYTYDGYGNVTRTARHGVTSVGGGACPACAPEIAFGVPCGASCLGDEATTETIYVPPSATGGRWIVHLPYRERRWGVEQSTRYRETLTYYDGEAFVGLPSGQLTLGAVTRVTNRVDEAGATVETERVRRDANGNIVESLNPNATLVSTTHREVLGYDAWGLNVILREVLLADAEGKPYAVRQEYKYDPAWALPSEATTSMLVEAGQVVSPRNSRFVGYDEFGRQSYAVFPGDSLQSPTTTWTYELASPVSRVVQRGRTKVGGPLDAESYKCFDGKGRLVQTRTRLADGKFFVDGFVARNQQGAVVRTWQPYTATSADCETAPPAGVLFSESRYDGAGRLRRLTMPDAALHGGTASFSETVYLPLGRKVLDAEDTDTKSPHAGTPTVFSENGLGWVTEIERSFAPGGVPARLRTGYTEHGDLAVVFDAAGHVKKQEHDLLGRLLKVEDPNSGTTHLGYDAAGNLTSRTDARNVTVRTSYDAANRAVETWNDADREGTKVVSHYDRSALCAATSCTNATGRLVATTYPLAGRGFGSDQFAYDVRGRLTRTRRTLDNASFELGFSYDNAGRTVGRTFPDGRALAMTWDAAGRQTGVEGVLDAVEYSPKNELSRVRHHNGIVTEWSWDDLSRLSGFTTGKAGAPLQSLGYARDRIGNITALTDRAKVTDRPDETATFTYDAAYRLLTAGLVGETLTFAYDAVDNVTSLGSSRATSPAHVGAYTYDAAHPNAVASAKSLAMTYDAAGNLLTRGTASFAWDHLGRKTSTSQSGVASSVDVYGPGVDRVIRQEGEAVAYHVDRDFEVRDGISSVFVRVGGERLARLESAALATKLFTDLAPAEGSGTLTSKPDGRIDVADAWLAHASKTGLVTLTGSASDPGQMLLSAARRVLLEARGEVVHLHRDHRRSLTLATDGTGNVLGRRSYYPNGLVRGDDDGGVGAYGFSGQELEEDSGLLHYQHRSLDPSLMRWASVDPLFGALTSASLGKLGESTTAYAYVANNAVNWTDPTGLKAVEFKGGTTNSAKLAAKMTTKRGLFGKRTRTFSSPEKAARFFLKHTMKKSIKHGVEFGAMIQSRGGRFELVGTTHGTGMVVEPRATNPSLVVGSVHTHPADPANVDTSRFSDADMNAYAYWAVNRGEHVGFMGSASDGAMYRMVMTGEEGRGFARQYSAYSDGGYKGETVHHDLDYDSRRPK